MREILFRGKTENDKWVYGNLYNTSDDKSYIIPKQTLYVTNQDEVEMRSVFDAYVIYRQDTVGQYREMIDKNGTKIFSGDCIIDINTAKHGMYLVTDVNEEQQLYYIDTRDGWVSKTVINFSHLDLKSIEVVGNIHDNKALLRNDR